MAYEQTLRTVGVPASADLSASQFCFMVVNSNGQLAVPSAQAVADGVLQDKPNGQGVQGELAILGVTKLVTGAAVTAGDPLTPDASGRGVTASAGNFVRARALASSSGAGIIIPALLIGAYKM
ncbi:MAG TPA: capsid cement protein [Bryobacteraceae bacterium]|nr:capsid cement protein [Bryobacteraceae bacterium]